MIVSKMMETKGDGDDLREGMIRSVRATFGRVVKTDVALNSETALAL
jgi:hypothetical protein